MRNDSTRIRGTNGIEKFESGTNDVIGNGRCNPSICLLFHIGAHKHFSFCSVRSGLRNGTGREVLTMRTGASKNDDGCVHDIRSAINHIGRRASPGAPAAVVASVLVMHGFE